MDGKERLDSHFPTVEEERDEALTQHTVTEVGGGMHVGVVDGDGGSLAQPAHCMHCYIAS